ncbi:hypothetical protein GCM10022416_58520 [Actinomadura keratinilytica]|uniref:Uncharacterized protein n=1 Tax=Actinomadura keratinilytica TaxID=547461 RepID=A0ABP7ZGF6_9ACTN
MGPLVERAVRLHTLHLSVRLIFPADLAPSVWGTETSTTAEATPLHNPITRQRHGDQAIYDWSTADPPLNARYRLECASRVVTSNRPHAWICGSPATA